MRSILVLLIIIVLPCPILASGFSIVYEQYIEGLESTSYVNHIIDDNGNFDGVIVSNYDGYSVDLYDSLGVLQQSIDLDLRPVQTINRYSENSDTLFIYILMENNPSYLPNPPYILSLISLSNDGYETKTVTPLSGHPDWVLPYGPSSIDRSGNVKFRFNQDDEAISLAYWSCSEYSEDVTTQGTWTELITTYIEYDLELNNTLLMKECDDRVGFVPDNSNDSIIAYIASYHTSKSHEIDDSFDNWGTSFYLLTSDETEIERQTTGNGYSYRLMADDFINTLPGDELIYCGYSYDLLDNYIGINKHLVCYNYSDGALDEIWYRTIDNITISTYCKESNRLIGIGPVNRIRFIDCSNGLFADSIDIDRNLSSTNFYQSGNRMDRLFGTFGDTAFIYQLNFMVTDIADNENIIPDNFELNQNHPNPFNPSTKIEYYLPRRSDVVISVFNILGRKVVTLVDENQPAGNNEVTWNGTDSDGEPVASGIYFYRLVTENDTQTRKMVLLK